MKKRNLFFNLALMSLFIFSGGYSSMAQTNLALTATVSTSYVSSWETLDAVKDNYQPSSSSDKGSGAYGNWKGASYYNTWEWVEYSFTRKNKIDSVRVYWWTDQSDPNSAAGIQIPYEAYVEYGDCGSLQKAGNIGVERNKYNTLVINKEAFKVRVNMISTAATGILEFQVFGSLGEETGLIPYIQVNEQSSQQISQVTVKFGDKLVLSNGLANLSGGSWSWSGPKGFSSTDSVLTLNNIQQAQIGKYTATYTTQCGLASKQSFVVLVASSTSSNYTWSKYSPKLIYDFRQDYPDFGEPTKDLEDCNGVAGTQHSKWWIFKWGKNRRSEVTDTAISLLLQRMDKDFTYFRDSMNWPPDKRAKNGYYSAIYLYGSGLCTDNEDTTALGGWQGSISYKGQDWPMVLASYYPVSSFDPNCTYSSSDISYQTGAMVHEGIHSVLADMPGCKDACWFQEGGNTWLQQEMTARQSGDYSSMGYLNGAPFLAPFMPIECYSGWLQDNSFGGPCAEGEVNKTNSSGSQICTWRNYLGGTQYGNGFPVFLGQTLGDASIPWIWQYCTGRVLEGLADTLGENQIRRLITEYRAKQATVDMGKWSGAVRKLLDSYINTKIASEWTPTWLNPDVWYGTPYARTTLDSTGTLTPEYRTTPGWSGANQIPLIVKGDSVSVKFKPIGENMKCQICYRDILGNAVYGAPVDSGLCAVSLAIPPANDVVIAVVSNTDFVFEGAETGKKHFDYRLQIDTNLVTPAHTQKRWYAWDQDPASDVTPELAAISNPDTLAPLDINLALNTISESDKINTTVGTLSTVDPNDVTLQEYTLVSGEGDTDNASFKISSKNLKIKRLLDYETKPVYSIRVRSTNLTDKYVEKSFTIPVNDVVETSVTDKFLNSKDVMVYPNPVNQSATVKLLNNETIQQIEIVNLTGATVRTISNINAGEYTINKENLANGIYYLKVNSSENYVVKVIFQ
ncbi:MAG TPA: T9SS type A sorting domain-containing protein [Prolixibacteraceae bacterium]|nr:T9SS type A sorting domain-containing protein [Prolixibacteraceae bacterium]